MNIPSHQHVTPPILGTHEGDTKKKKISPSIVLNLAELRIQGEGGISKVTKPYIYIWNGCTESQTL